MEVWLFRLLVVAAAALFARQMLARYRLIARAPGTLDAPSSVRASARSSARSSSRARPSPRARWSASRTSSSSGASAPSPATRLVEALRGLGLVDLTGTAAFHVYELALVPFAVGVLGGIVAARDPPRRAAAASARRRRVEGIAADQRLHRGADDHVPGRRGGCAPGPARRRRAARAGQLVGAHAGHPGLHRADPRLQAPAPAAVAGDGVPARADPRHRAEARFREGADRPRNGGAAGEEAGPRRA